MLVFHCSFTKFLIFHGADPLLIGMYFVAGLGALERRKKLWATRRVRHRGRKIEISSIEMHPCESFMCARICNRETNHVGCGFHDWERNPKSPNSETKYVFDLSNIGSDIIVKWFGVYIDIDFRHRSSVKIDLVFYNLMNIHFLECLCLCVFVIALMPHVFDLFNFQVNPINWSSRTSL